MNRKLLITCLIFVAAAWLLALMPGCGGSESNPQEEQLKALTATWTLNSVTNDGTDVSSQYSGFSLNANAEKTYSTINGGNAWPANGTFDFADDSTTDRLLRDDGVVISILSLTDTSLELNFSVSTVRGEANGSAGITGNFTFNLQKQ